MLVSHRSSLSNRKEDVGFGGSLFTSFFKPGWFSREVGGGQVQLAGDTIDEWYKFPPVHQAISRRRLVQVFVRLCVILDGHLAILIRKVLTLIFFLMFFSYVFFFLWYFLCFYFLFISYLFICFITYTFLYFYSCICSICLLSYVFSSYLFFLCFSSHIL